MNVLLLARDAQAKSFVRNLFGEPGQVSSSGEIEIWGYPKGGRKSIVVFSLSDDEMFFDTTKNRPAIPDGRRTRVSIWEARDMFPKRGETAEWGEPTKSWNKAMRPKLTPQELQKADAFVAVNQSTTGGFDFRSIGANLLQMSRIKLPPGTEERGGYAAYTMLPQDRVVYPNDLRPPVDMVCYGTSGSHNIAELLLTLAVGHKLDLPVEFDNYGKHEEETLGGQMSMVYFVHELSKAVEVNFQLTLTSTATETLDKIGLNGKKCGFLIPF